MSRRLSLIALFAAWLCASGAMLDVVQVFAWARMFTRYAETMPVGEAALETMDASKPCPICMAVRRARQESKPKQPASIAGSTTKLDLVCHEAEAPVFAREPEAWPDVGTPTPGARREPVPVPPPRPAVVESET